jgi:hypothetical protein
MATVQFEQGRWTMSKTKAWNREDAKVAKEVVKVLNLTAAFLLFAFSRSLRLRGKILFMLLA